MDQRRRGPVIETLPARPIGPVAEKSPNGVSETHIEMIDLPSYSRKEISPPSEINGERSAEGEVQEQLDRTTSASENTSKKATKGLSLWRDLSKRLSQESVGVPYQGRERKRGRLVTILKAIRDPNTTEEVEPLTLSNPVSESLKVCQLAILTHPCSLSWLLDPRQFPSSDSCCAFDQC